MDEFLKLTVSGALTGAIYSLIAAGITLSYSATGIFNFSYGAVAFSSAFLYFELHSGLHWNIVPAAFFTIAVFAPLLGLLLNVAVFRPLARATESAKIMATVGLSVALPSVPPWVTDEIVNVFHAHIPTSSDVTQAASPPGIGPVPKHRWHPVAHIPFDSDQLIVLITAVVVAVALWYLMRRTTLGLKMRAVVDRANLARTRGVDDAMTSRYAWVIGMVLAALAGVVGAPVLGSIDPNVYINIMFVASAAAIIGRLRSIPMAFVGGLALSLVFISFVIVTGQGGMISLAQATFVTTAGLTTGMLLNRYHWPFLAAALIGVAVTVAIGVVVAIPALRLGGLPLALATLALALLGDQLLFQWNWLRNRQSGWTIKRPALGPIHLSDNRSLAMFLLVLVAIT